MMQRNFAALAAAWLLVAGCTHRPIDLQNLACDAGECVDGYTCHPELGICVLSVSVRPSEVDVGASCSSPGSFVPCVEGVSDCSQGCYTCTDGRWSECTGHPGC